MGCCGSSSKAPPPAAPAVGHHPPSPPPRIKADADGDSPTGYFAKGQVESTTPAALTAACDMQKIDLKQSMLGADYCATAAEAAKAALETNDSFLTCHGDDGEIPSEVQVFFPKRSFALPEAAVLQKRVSFASRATRSLPRGVGCNIPRDKKSKHRVMTKWDFTTDPSVVEWLKTGGCCFAFMCNPGAKLSEAVVRMMAPVINMSAFQDELRENACPRIDLSSAQDLDSHIFVLTKAMYVLPAPIPASAFTPEVLSSYEYQKGCMPESTKVWSDGESGWTRQGTSFRITKTIIRFIFKITIQFRVSQVPESQLSTLSVLMDGLQVHRALLLERTKRDVSQVDSTKKVKSVVLFHDLDGGGVLVVNSAVVVQASIPSIVAATVDKFGSLGAEEVGDTADKTRKHMLSKV